MLRHNDYINILKELKTYSIVIYYLYKLNIINKEEIENVLYQDDIEKSTLFYMRLLNKINDKEQDKSIKLSKEEITKAYALKNIIKRSTNTYSHLETMTSLLVEDTEINKILNDKNHLEFIKLKRLEELINLSCNYNNLNYVQSCNRYKEELNKLKLKNLKEIEKNINNYYMQKVVH